MIVRHPNNTGYTFPANISSEIFTEVLHSIAFWYILPQAVYDDSYYVYVPHLGIQ